MSGRVGPRAAAVPAAVAAAALLAGCSLSGAPGTTVHLRPVLPEATTVVEGNVELVDAYLVPTRAGGAVVFAGTLSNTALRAQQLVRVSAPSGSATVDVMLAPGAIRALRLSLGTARTALGRGKALPVTFTFHAGAPLTVRVPVGGTPARG